MRLTIPEKISSSDIISNTATNTVAAYNSGTTYSVGNICYEGDYVYESAKNSNTGKTPHLYAGGVVVNSDWLEEGYTAIADPYWINMRKINPLAMFDSYLYTQTTKTGAGSVSIYLKYSKANCNGIYFLNIDATSVNIVLKDSIAIELKSISVDLFYNLDLTLDEYDWCWSPVPSQLSDIYIDFGIPLSATDTVEITATGTSNVAIGKIVTGYAHEMGVTQWGYTTGILDYSKTTPDDYGEASLREGRYAKTIQAVCVINIADIDPIWSKLVAVRAKNIIVDFNPTGTNYSHLIHFGLAKECKQSAISYNDTKLSLTINGAI